jgi:hypothetical protein
MQRTLRQVLAQSTRSGGGFGAASEKRDAASCITSKRRAAILDSASRRSMNKLTQASESHRWEEKMNRGLLTHTCAVLVLAITGCASTSPRLEGPNELHLLDGAGPYKYDCMAHNAYFEYVDTPKIAKHVRVTGTMHVIAMHSDPKWGSAAAIGFKSDSTKYLVALQLLVMPSDPQHIVLTIRGDGAEDNSTVFARQANKPSDFPFTIILDQGIVSASVAQFSATSKDGRPDLMEVDMSCSGAHVKFSDVRVAEVQ